MDDLFGREKYVRLPRGISDGGEHTHTYEIGQLACWLPGPHLNIYYHNDGRRIPDPGVIIIGKVDAGVEALNVVGTVTVTIEPGRK
jgi:hypothetical protein